MRTVRDEDGQLLLVVTESSDAVRVRDPETGEERYVDGDSLDPVDGASPLVTASRAIPPETRRILTAVHDERALGLLVDLEARGPLAVTTLLETTALCESDLHGMLGEFRAAGLVEETEVAGVRGYRLTETAEAGLASLLE